MKSNFYGLTWRGLYSPTILWLVALVCDATDPCTFLLGNASCYDAFDAEHAVFRVCISDACGSLESPHRNSWTEKDKFETMEIFIAIGLVNQFISLLLE